jgi:hypothetical protein
MMWSISNGPSVVLQYRQVKLSRFNTSNRNFCEIAGLSTVMATIHGWMRHLLAKPKM